MKRIHIDTDPGVDDLLALGMALASPEIEVVGVTTVAGNATLDAVTDNARRFLSLAGSGIGVGRGAERPLRAPLVTAAHVHGEDGRQGVELPAGDEVPLLDAKEVFERSLGDLEAAVLVALGPLTNVAILMERAPELLARVEIVWMGGSLARGNVTPLAEFNCYVDPHAARAVLGSSVPIRVVGLDVTSEIAIRPEDLARGPFGPGARGNALSELLARGMRAEAGASQGGVILHDPTAIAAVVAPEHFRFEERSLSVRTEMGAERGRLLASRAPDTGTVRYATSVEGPAVSRLCMERLRRFALSPEAREA